MSLSVGRETLGVNRELQMGPPFQFIEFTQLTTTGTLTHYAIGTVANVSEPGRMPRFFVAKRIMVYCTQECYLRWNNSRAVRILIPANAYFVFDTMVANIYYERVTVNGTLRLWIQG